MVSVCWQLLLADSDMYYYLYFDIVLELPKLLRFAVKVIWQFISTLFVLLAAPKPSHILLQVLFSCVPFHKKYLFYFAVDVFMEDSA